MGVGIMQWRARIGVFRHRMGWRQIETCRVHAENQHDSTDMHWGYRLVVCTLLISSMVIISHAIDIASPGISRFLHLSAIDIWKAHIPTSYLHLDDNRYAIIHTSGLVGPHMGICSRHPFVPYLLTIGNVEVNPGPVVRTEDLVAMKSDIIKHLGEYQADIKAQLTSIGSNVDCIKSKCESLETTCVSIRHDVMDLKGRVENLESDMEARKGNEHVVNLDIDALCERMDAMESKVDGACCNCPDPANVQNDIDRLEAYSRRDNLIFYNIDESDDDDAETYDYCARVLSDILQANVPREDRNWCMRDFVRVHRLRKGENRPPGEPRPLIARFLHWQDKRKVHESRELLFQAGIKVVNDLTYRQRQQLRDLQAQGKNGYFKRGQLIAVDKPAYVTRNNGNHDRIFRRSPQAQADMEITNDSDNDNANPINPQASR